MLNISDTTKQRIRDFKTLCFINELTYKEVIEAAGFPYKSTINNMRTGLISDVRLSKIEQTATKMRDAKLKKNQLAVNS